MSCVALVGVTVAVDSLRVALPASRLSCDEPMKIVHARVPLS